MDYTTKLEQERALQKCVQDLSNKVMRIWYIFVAIGVIVCCFAVYLAENQLSYVEYETKTKTETYQHKIGEVWTDLCYTTITGECYHADGCQ